MMAALSAFGMCQEFDAFLYAPVGGEVDHMPLSVLSALARLNLDPWREASELSKLPQETAVHRLAGLIARLPATQSGKIDSAKAAERLVSLLPRPSLSIVLPGKVGGGFKLPTLSSTTIVTIIAAVLLAAAVLFANTLDPSSRHIPFDVPISSQSPPQTP